MQIVAFLMCSTQRCACDSLSVCMCVDWMSDRQRITNRNGWQMWRLLICNGWFSRRPCWQPVALHLLTSVHMSHSRCPSKPTTVRKINDSYLKDTFFYIHSQRNRIIYRHRHRWCNFIIVHRFCGWACLSAAESNYPEVVIAQEKLVPPCLIMMAIETLKYSPWAFCYRICCSVLCCLFVTAAFLLYSSIHKFYGRNRNNVTRKEKQSIHYQKK